MQKNTSLKCVYDLDKAAVDIDGFSLRSSRETGHSAQASIDSRYSRQKPDPTVCRPYQTLLV